MRIKQDKFQFYGNPQRIQKTINYIIKNLKSQRRKDENLAFFFPPLR